MSDVWANGDAYEPYIGRWSRLVATEFLDWLAIPVQQRWFDVGCGPGTLSAAIVARWEPAAVVGIDPSKEYVSWAADHMEDPRVHFAVGDATDLPANGADVVVSGLVLNFMPDPAAALAAMREAAPSGIIAAYVWDYAGRMELIRHFWNAAVALDPAAAQLDEGVRFPICRPDALEALWDQAGFTNVASRTIDVPTRFRDFEEYWTPFLGGQGPAPSYAMSLDDEHRATLRERIRAGLPIAPDGSVSLLARAWAIKGQAV